MKKTKLISFIVSVLIMSFFVGYLAFAWQEPTQSPPQGNVPTPVNVGSVLQTKAGSLIVQGFESRSTTVLAASGGNVGIGTTSPGQRLDVAGTIRATGNNILNNTSPTTFYQDSDHRSAMVHVNSNFFYVLRGCDVNSLSWCTVGGRWPLVINLENNDATFGRNVHATGNIRADSGFCIGTSCITSWPSGSGDHNHDDRYLLRHVNNWITTSDNQQRFYFANNSHSYFRSPGNIYFRTGGDNTRMIIDSSGRVGIGTTSPSSSYRLHVNGAIGATAFYYTSDERLKENIKPLGQSLLKVLKLNGISYKLKETKEQKIGLSAQQVQQVFPEAVNEDDNGMLSIDSAALIAPLIEAIKEQQQEIENLKKIIENK